MPVQADVVFSNLGPGDSFLHAAWGLGGSRPQDIGMRFTAGADFDFRSIEMALLGEGAPARERGALTLERHGARRVPQRNAPAKPAPRASSLGSA